MSSQINGLSDQQLSFLEANFVVYDPETRECYQDFSRLNEYQVVLIGEMHLAPILYHIQGLFLKLFVQDPSCLLVEYLPPGQSINRDQIPHWEDLPKELSIKGSDIRRTWSQQQVTELLPLRYRIIRLKLQFKEDLRKDMRLIASILNKGLFSAETQLKGKGIIEVTKPMMDELDVIEQRITQKREQFDQEIKDLRQKIKLINLDSISFIDLTRIE